MAQAHSALSNASIHPSTHAYIHYIHIQTTHHEETLAASHQVRLLEGSRKFFPLNFICKQTSSNACSNPRPLKLQISLLPVTLRKHGQHRPTDRIVQHSLSMQCWQAVSGAGASLIDTVANSQRYRLEQRVQRHICETLDMQLSLKHVHLRTKSSLP